MNNGSRGSYMTQEYEDGGDTKSFANQILRKFKEKHGGDQMSKEMKQIYGLL